MNTSEYPAIIPFEDNKIKLLPQKNTLVISLTGDIVAYRNDALLSQLKTIPASQFKNIKFVTDNLQNWDSSLLLIIFETLLSAQTKQQKCDISALPENLQKLIQLAFTVSHAPSSPAKDKKSFFENIGYKAFLLYKIIMNTLNYLKTIFCSLGRFVTAHSIMRKKDFWVALTDCGPAAIGIVSLISFLVGLILAFVGAVQLQTFGAQIYVASLVTIGMCRIMGAIMVGIIMAGRTGSSYAATIGTMQVNEELDALETMGLSKIDFLVLPRLLSLLLAMPILTMLADFMGILGGASVGIFIMNLPAPEYWKYALNAFALNNFLIGIFHGLCFGFIIALCGCYSGLTCGRKADSVGVAATQSVVCAIVWMIVITGIITVICQELGI